MHEKSESQVTAPSATMSQERAHRLMLMSLPSMAFASSSGRTELEIWCEVTVPLLSDLCEMLMSRVACGRTRRSVVRGRGGRPTRERGRGGGAAWLLLVRVIASSRRGSGADLERRRAEMRGESSELWRETEKREGERQEGRERA